LSKKSSIDYLVCTVLGVAALSCAVFASCGGSGEKESLFADAAVDEGAADASIKGKADAGIKVDVDASVPVFPDGGFNGICNPVSQLGCGPGEKCAQVVESESPFLAHTTCVPNGDVEIGEPCEQGDPGPFGFDDCEAGLACNGICVGICSVGPPQSKQNCGDPQDESCVLFQNTFDDVGNSDIGLCAPACDPATQTLLSSGVPSAQSCPMVGERDPGCYLSSVLGTTSCSGVPDGMPGDGIYQPLDRTQDDDCYGPGLGQCFLNGCSDGFGPVLNNPDGGATSWCVAFCRPINVFDGAQAAGYFDDFTVAGGTVAARERNAARGDLGSGLGCNPAKIAGGVAPSDEYDCRFISRFYGNTSATPDAYGMCVPRENVDEDFGSCDGWDLDAWLTASAETKPDGSLNPGYDDVYCTNGNQSVNAPVNYSRCPRGCIGIEALEEIYDDFVFPSFLTATPVVATPGVDYIDPKLLEIYEKYMVLAPADIAAP